MYNLKVTRLADNSTWGGVEALYAVSVCVSVRPFFFKNTDISDAKAFFVSFLFVEFSV